MKPATFINLALAFLPMFPMAQQLSYIRDDQGILVRDGTADVLFYQTKAVSYKGEFERAHYIHPLYGIDGAVLTEDFPPDHLHHRGIFWAWHQVVLENQKLGDAWECRNFIWDVGNVDLVPADSSLVLKTKVIWKSPEYADKLGVPIPLLEEDTHIRIYNQYENYRVFNFEISLQPLAGNIKLGGSEDDKGYGGFSVRLKLPADPTFTSDSGVVGPEENAIRAGNWVSVSGALGKKGEAAGVVIISRNKFDMAGTRWILRRENSMQNAVFPGREPVELPEEEALLLQYSIIVFKGSLPGKEIDKIIQTTQGYHE